MKLKIIFLLIAMFLLNGFSNARELNELSIVSAIGVDLNQDGEYVITAQILNTKKENSSGSGSGSASGSSEIIVLKSTSSSIQTALRNTIKESPRKLYLAHMELLLISEKIAKEKNILDTLNFFIRDNEGSNDFMLVITKDTTPQEILNVLTPQESNPAQSITDSILATNKYKGAATENILNENISMFLSQGEASVVISIELSDGNEKTENIDKGENNQNDNKQNEGLNKDSVNTQESALLNSGGADTSSGKSDSENSNTVSNEEKKIKVSSLGYFKDKTLTGYIKESDAYIYNLLQDNAEGGIIEIGQNEDLLVIEQISSKTKITPKVENDKYIADIDIELVCNVTEVGKNNAFDSTEAYENNKKIAQEHLKSKIEEFIKDVKEEYQCDLIGIGNLFYKYKNSDYNILKTKYADDYYKNVDFNINVSIKFPNEGGIHDVW